MIAPLIALQNIKNEIEYGTELGSLSDIMKYFRDELLCLEKQLSAMDPSDEQQSILKRLGLLERLAGEQRKFLDEAKEALAQNAGKKEVFDLQKLLRPLQGIFEFKALQRDIHFEFIISELLPEKLTGDLALLKGLLDSLLNYIIQQMKEGEHLRCEFRPSNVDSEGLRCSFFFASSSTEADNGLVSEFTNYSEKLLKYLIQSMLKKSGSILSIDESSSSCNLDFISKKKETAQKTHVKSEITASPAPVIFEMVPKSENLMRQQALELLQIGPLVVPQIKSQTLKSQLHEKARGEEREVTQVEDEEKEVQQESPFSEEISLVEEVRDKDFLQVIVAEENLLIQRFFRELIEAEGHSVLCVSNGKELLSRLEEDDFDVCILECQMGTVDAYKATGLIRAREAKTGKRIRIIGVSSQLDVDTEERCLKAGMDAYLTKPIHKGKLQKLISDFGKGR
ncbi:MAG: response regulator [SAR324 cluster bacterium]|uniref:Response regulator n=1 Tax=SAR324 cluster bacterium TaxID=2024889 RepID=A0A7X9FP57_9DELT|nr:response regulator [SAR324 cluster bacterium]